jgi:hypothetical protein
MSKKNKRRQQPNVNGRPGANGATASTAAPPAAVVQEVDQILNAALEVATLEEVDAPQAPVDPNASADRLKRDAAEAKRIFDAARKRLEGEREKVEQDRRKLTEKTEALKLDLENLARERATLASAQKELTDRAERVALEEQDALAGFSERRWAHLEQLRREEATLQQRMTDVSSQLVAEHARMDADRLQHLDALRVELDGIRKSVRDDDERARAEFEQERQQLAGDRRELELDRRELVEHRRTLDRQVEREVERQVREVRRERDELAAQVAELTTRLDTLQSRLAAADRLTQRFHGKEPQEVLSDMVRLQQENEGLREELANRPTRAEGDRLQQLELSERKWTEERSELRQRVAEFEAVQAEAQTAGWQVEALRRERAELEKVLELQEARLEKLKREIEENLRNATDANPFRAFRDLDESPDRQKAPTTKAVSDLSKLTVYLQYRIAELSAPNPLHYTEEDLRLFLAGMAMSPLMILQGVSGTGKTSLPLSVARAIGAGRYRHPVQAGWRDRQDLLGHFNSFEGRFYATGFLHALYEAQTPAFADRPYIIVLDEMNLSSPEQYFADFLSEFEEREANERKIRLLDQQVADGPRLLLEGNAIRIPENVWFVGTANHDETTLGFAPKTYDRAHVMDLYRRGTPPIQAKRAKDQGCVSYKALREQFARAAQDHASDCIPLLEFIYGDLKTTMYRLFRVGWGQRLERQVQQFVPVIRACGGTVSEAADHIVSTKIIRTIRHRHDNRTDYLEELAELIASRWPYVAKDGRPERSLALLNEELADRRNDAVRDAL